MAEWTWNPKSWVIFTVLPYVTGKKVPDYFRGEISGRVKSRSNYCNSHQTFSKPFVKIKVHLTVDSAN